jgi:hypothetical protein
MSMRISRILAASAALLLYWSAASAQNVTGYGAIPNPYLLLLREPAVLDELRLTAAQRVELRQINDEVDGPFLASRNWPPEKAHEKLSELIEQTRVKLQRVLQDSQQERLGQIILRLRGAASVALPPVAKQLQLSPSQLRAIEATLEKTREEINILTKQLREGASRREVERKAALAQQREQRNVLRELSGEQQLLFRRLLGPSFDPARLGRARFKAPELIGAGPWIHSQPLRLADLRGQVIALHFLAYG